MPNAPTPEIARAAEILRAGRLVAMPTETVYGLAGDATRDDAVALIFETKRRPTFNPLIVHVSGQPMAEREAEFSRLARKLALAFWPGPLTLVLPRKSSSSLSLLVSAGLDTVAIRMPAHRFAHDLIRAAGRPLAAPSANLSGTISPTTAAHVAESLGASVDMILDGGPAEIGVESTILKVEADRVTLLRPGGLSVSEIEAEIAAPVGRETGVAIEAPGMLASHYAPAAALRVNAVSPDPEEFYLAFGPGPFAWVFLGLNLSPEGAVREAAANLFAFLRAADRNCATHRLKGIAAAPIPSDGLGEAINDRLRRAAAPRGN